MVFKVKSREEFIRTYIKILSGPLRISAREADVAVIIILYFTKIRESANNSGEEFTDKELMLKVASMEFVSSMTTEVGMSVPVFRNYVTELKRKGFISGGVINKSWIPKENSAVVEVKIVT